MTRGLRIVFALALVSTFMFAGGRLTLEAGPVSAAQTTNGGAEIADPRIDPAATLQDAVSISHSTPSAAGPLAATGEVESNMPEYLSSGVQLEDVYAQYSFVVPSSPNQDWMMGFTFWDDGHGNYYDLAIISDPGSVLWGLGVTTGYQYDVKQVEDVADARGLDFTPGAVNTLSLVFYDGFVMLAGNDTILAQVDMGVSGSGDVRAKVGWGIGRGTPVPPVTISISDFSVWELPADGVMAAGTSNQSAPSPGAAPIQTPGAFVSNDDQTAAAAASPTAAPAQLTPTTAFAPDDTELELLTGIFDKERSDAIAGGALWYYEGHVLTQNGSGSFDVQSEGTPLTDFYAIATFVNPDDMSTVSDYGIGIRDNNDNREFRFVVDTTGQWSISLGSAAPFAQGMTTVDASPGASITIEVIAMGATGMLAVDGRVVTQVDLSANLNAGYVYIASGMNPYALVDGRRVTSSLVAVYPLGA
ncbi:MAG TPA: hypothetical protein VFP05_17230 [Thermomicrobiales bacterium]|nr:hypothetical protein [Thermomicrobiales bacterium]